jgi:hypothetical protein
MNKSVAASGDLNLLSAVQPSNPNLQATLIQLQVKGMTANSLDFKRFIFTQCSAMQGRQIQGRNFVPSFIGYNFL